MRVAVVGAGVVGLSTVVGLLDAGVEVVCFEAAAVMGERSAGSSRIFRLAHTDPGLVRLAVAARDAFARWSAHARAPLVDPVGAVVTGGDAAQRAEAMAAVGVPHELRDGGDVPAGLPVRTPPTGPVLVDPNGGVVDVAALRALLVARAGHVVAPERVEDVTDDGSAATVRTAGGAHRFDAVVVAAGAGTSALATGIGIPVPSALQHHARVTFPLPEPPADARRPAWIDVPAEGLHTYQHRSGAGRWSVGGTMDDDLVAWEVGREAATAASREVLLAYARERLTVDPRVVDTLYCTHAPNTGDGIAFGRSGAVLAVWGENLMKFAPVLGEVLAAAAIEGSTPSVPALATRAG